MDGVKELLADDVTIVMATHGQQHDSMTGSRSSAQGLRRGHESVLKRGEAFPKRHLRGMPYIAYYLPRKDSRRNAVGILFGGNPQARAQAVVNQMILLYVGFGAAALLLIALLLILYTRAVISRPLGRLVETARQIAAGNLNVRLVIHSKNEIGELAEAFAQMSLKPHEMNRRHRRGRRADRGGFAAGLRVQRRAGLRRTDRPAPSREFSSSLEQILRPDRAELRPRQARPTSCPAPRSQRPRRANAQMQAMLTAMSEINRASEDIAKIIKVIDDIAFPDQHPGAQRRRGGGARGRARQGLRGGGRGGALPRRALAQAAKQRPTPSASPSRKWKRARGSPTPPPTCSAPS